jgi:proline iminopeptidase
MDPAHMEWMANELPRGRYLGLPDGSHLAMYDDQERYFEGAIRFIRDVESGAFPAPPPSPAPPD